jgi:hypothetical protein
LSFELSQHAASAVHDINCVVPVVVWILQVIAANMHEERRKYISINGEFFEQIVSQKSASHNHHDLIFAELQNIKSPV